MERLVARSSASGQQRLLRTTAASPGRTQQRDAALLASIDDQRDNVRWPQSLPLGLTDQPLAGALIC